jgi:hypothetical protein
LPQFGGVTRAHEPVPPLSCFWRHLASSEEPDMTCGIGLEADAGALQSIDVFYGHLFKETSVSAMNRLTLRMAGAVAGANVTDIGTGPNG